MCSQAYVFIVCANGIPMGIYETMQNARESVRLQAEHLNQPYHLDDNHAHVQGNIGDVGILIQGITQGPHDIGLIW